MPRDVASCDSLFHALAIRCIRLFQIAIKQPGAGRPYKSRLSIHARVPGNRDGLWIELRKVFPDHRRLRVDEADIQVALKHHQNLLDILVRGKSRRGEPIQKFTPIHLFNCIYISSSPRVLYRCVDLDLPSNSDFSLVDDGKPSPEVGVSEQEKNPLKGLANCCFTGRMNAQPHDAWSALRWKADHVRKVLGQYQKRFGDVHPMMV
jgi:hypothetical protein